MKTVVEVLKGIRPEFDFTTSEDFIADGMLDSFDVVTLISELDQSYGISIAWSDGHATGIYRFGFLREICPCPTCRRAGSPRIPAALPVA